MPLQNNLSSFQVVQGGYLKERKEIMLIILVMLVVYCVGLVSGVVCVCLVNVGAAGNKRPRMICKETDIKCRKPMEERNDDNQDNKVYPGKAAAEDGKRI